MRLIFLHVVFLVDVMPVHQSTLSSQHWHTRLILCPSHAVKSPPMDVLLVCKKKEFFVVKKSPFLPTSLPRIFLRRKNIFFASENLAL